jgi:integrase
VASVWIRTRPTKDGGKRYRVEYRAGGRGERPKYGGSFRTMREANLRKAWIVGELAAQRVPDIRAPRAVERAPTFAEAAEAWRASRVDVTSGTRTLHRVALNRALPTLGNVALDEITTAHMVDLVRALAERGAKRETIRKTVKYAAAVLDEAGIEPNPARDSRVRLPHEETEDLVPPEAAHVEAVCRLLPSAYRLPLLWLDWSGARVGSLDRLLVGDYDEERRRVRLRRSATKTRTPLWVELPDVLADALEATLAPRDDRDPEAPLFADVGADRLRTAIARACRAAGVPVFSPHDLRHRRISVLHRQGRSWAEIARFVGQRKLSVTADTYTHVLVDGREADYVALLAEREHARGWNFPPDSPSKSM